MRERQTWVGVRRLLGAAALAVAAGVAAGLLLATTGSARQVADGDPARLITATHVPPLLTLAGETVTLGYDVYCAPPGLDPESGAPCDAAGTVYVRPAGTGTFRPYPLRLDAGALDGRYAVSVPPEIASATAGFEYYAVLRSRTSGASTVLPAGGPLAPQRSRPLTDPIDVRLGGHVFGRPVEAAERVAAATWGTGDGQVGLEQGPEQQPIGGTSFDVSPSGAVTVLDEANRRVLRFDRRGVRPATIPLGVRGTLADLAVDADGAMTVLENVGDKGETPLLRTFDDRGGLRGAVHIAEHDASAVELGPDGPVALQYPAGQWMPVSDRGAVLGAAEQRRRGRGGRIAADGTELVAQREGREARIAEADASGVRRAWRIESDTPLGEIQLARRLGRNVVVGLRVYTDARDEFEILVLGDRGVVRRFAIDSRAWAETAPLARLRLRGSSLYALGSDQRGLHVDRYDLGASS